MPVRTTPARKPAEGFSLPAPGPFALVIAADWDQAPVLAPDARVRCDNPF